MPANEFEKQVQKRLDDFQLNPSASVWKNVEAQIRKKTRRRIILFFLLPLALGLLTYSIYYFVQAPQKTEQGQHVTVKNTDSSTTDINQTSETTKQPGQAKPNEKIKSDELSIIKPGTETVSPVNKTVKGETEIQITSAKPSADHRKTKPSIIQNNEIAIAKKKENTTKDHPSLVPVARAQIDNEVVVTIDKPGTGRVSKNQNEPPTVNDQPGATVAESKAPVTAKSDEIKTEDIVADTKDPVTAKADSAKPEVVVKTNKEEAIPQKKSSRLKIKWGFDVSGGITSSETKVFSTLKSYRSDAVAVNNSGPIAAASPFPGAATTLPPSSVEPGGGFRAAVVGELGISKRSRISMGLQYMYASNQIRTGTADRALRYTNNSFGSVDQIYRGPQTNSYKNSYHFVAIPVAYHWQFNKSEKTGVRWNVSVSPSYLVSTDALVYSSSNGGSYYHDKSAFNKFHFSIGTGLSLRLKAKKGMEYILGPEISFDTRKLMSNAYQEQQYLIYAGIGARVLFPSKKK